ncbi:MULTISPECIES: archaellin/type IV pilin N-terminal domain-containing protein [Methanoculleus]|uniref:Flagellin n=2 Tax=Methanoculleus TaxID=45989 RepID=A3CU45_METMJ|nr:MULTISPECIES: flagellin [Methanoculleus]ABN56895.1 flagellin [Methanoculleus marisnigri JR1]UYU18323.1 flagellin [Methanoculleus submarinus]
MKRQFNDNAFTGLEAAIVLIAFIVVAAVFSYVVLGAGFFTTQKSQEVVHTGVSQASSSMEIVGYVYGLQDSASLSTLGSITFVVANTAGGTAIDVKQMVVTYVDEDHHDVLTYAADESSIAANEWAVVERYNSDDGTSDMLLEPGEQFELVVAVPNPGVNKAFTVNLQPAAGAVYPIKKTVPPAIEPINLLP